MEQHLLEKYQNEWREQGYLIVRQAFDTDYITRLHQVCEKIFEQWKCEGTVDTEPAGHCYGPAGWILIHLNHSRYHRDNSGSLPILLNAIANPLALQITRQIFQEQPLFAQANYYFDPPVETRIGDWHRDCQFYSRGNVELEKAYQHTEADPPRELHMHIPLVPTAASEVVPGSHLRWDTDEEWEIRRNNPRTDDMPGRLSLQLQPGDLAFFHVNAIHRGLYIPGIPRRTIAVTLSRASQVRMPSAHEMKHWKGYIATYQPWLLKPGYLDGTTDTTREFFQRFINTYQEGWKSEFVVPELGQARYEYYTQF